MRAIRNDMDRPIEENKLLELLKSNIRPDISYRMGNKKITTIDECITESRKAEVEIERCAQYKPPSSVLAQHPIYGTGASALPNRATFRSFLEIKVQK